MRARNEIERLRAALREIVAYMGSERWTDMPDGDKCDTAIDIARAALEGKK